MKEINMPDVYRTNENLEKMIKSFSEDTSAPDKSSVLKDDVNHPSHYTQGKIEVIEAIEAWGCGYHDGNAIKYVARYKHKGNPVKDLKKARWYIDRLIKNEESKKE